MPRLTRFIRPISLFGVLLATCTGAVAQDYPTKPVRLVVPYAAGTTPDNMARIFQQELAKHLGQSIIIDTRPGADGAIGLEHVAKAAPADGYTMAIAQVSGLAILPLLQKNMRFDPLKDLPPLVGLVEGKYILSTPATMPANSFNEFVALAKANPGKYNFGASNSTVRMQTEALVRELGLNMVYVPYKSGAVYLQALGSNEVQLGLTAEGSAVTLATRVRVLAVTGAQRSTNFPNAPTFSELGLTGVTGVGYSLNVRAGTPKAITDKIESAALRMLQNPDVKARLAKMGLDTLGQPAEVAAKRLADENRTFTDVARRIGIQPE